MATNTDKLTEVALDWLNANTVKNKATSEERKAKEQLEKLVASDTVKTVEVDDGLSLQIGWMDDKSEEIDPKKLFAKDPDLFWKLVSIPKTNCVAQMGEKEAAKCMRTVTKNAFKVVKEKRNKRK